MLHHTSNAIQPAQTTSHYLNLVKHLMTLNHVIEVKREVEIIILLIFKDVVGH